MDIRVGNIFGEGFCCFLALERGLNLFPQAGIHVLAIFGSALQGGEVC